MNPSAAGPVVGSGRYEFAPALDGLRGLPIQVWSTRSLTARWRRPAAAVDLQTSVLQADLTDEDQSLVGTITNNLKFPLSKCILAYDHWAYELDPLQPGQAVALGTMTPTEQLRHPPDRPPNGCGKRQGKLPPGSGRLRPGQHRRSATCCE